MYIAAINFSVTDIVVLNVMAIVLGIVIHFVLSNRRNLQKLIKESEAQYSLSGSAAPPPAFEDMDMLHPLPVKETKPAQAPPPPSLKKDKKEEPLFFKPKAKPAFRPEPEPQPSLSADVLGALKSSIQQQQRALNGLLAQVDEWQAEAAESVSKEAVEALEIKLEEKELELEKVKQQLSTSQKMAARIDDVYKEFDALQHKIAALERQAKGANELAIELDDVRESYTTIKKELTRKQDKLQEAVEENQRLYRQLNETEDKLAEANLQRQQLFKKVQFLENLNTEVQQVTDANKKLQNELRRIGELESMLSMVSDERDLLLKKRSY